MATAQLTPVKVGIHNVLIATDFSQFSNTALAYGLELARSFQAEAHVVSVVASDAFMLAGPEAYVDARDAAGRDLAKLKEELRAKYSYVEGQDYHLRLLEGEVAQSILAYAQEKKIDLIVVGTHGRSGLGKMMMGSVAERVFRQSPVPVLTIGPHVHRPRAAAPSNILVPIDFGPTSGCAARYGVALAREHDAKLTMLHVIDRWPVEAQADRERVLQGLREKIAELINQEAEGLRCSFRIEVGQVVETILYTANGIEADLVVMGVRPWTGAFDRLRWPHAYQVVREASSPVLTVRAHDGH